MADHKSVRLYSANYRRFHKLCTFSKLSLNFITIIQKGRKEKVDHCSTVNIVKYFIKFAIR